MSEENVYKVGQTLTIRFNAADQATMNKLVEDLRASGKKIDGNTELFWALVQGVALPVNPENIPEVIELRARVQELEAALEPLESIEITQIRGDLKLANERNDQLEAELKTLQEKNAQFDKEHYPLVKRDPRLVNFFSGAEYRISNQVKNINGRVTRDYTDVIEDLVILAANLRKRNVLDKNQGF